MPFSFDGFPTLNETDLTYGLEFERYRYWQVGPFKNLEGRHTIDAYAINNKELSVISDPEKIPYKNNEFIQYISDHEKFSSIQTARSARMFGGWTYENPSLVLGRKCKAGLGWASENDIHVNFILDRIDMEQVVGTSGKPRSKSITSKELRYLYRNRNNEAIRRNVQFWNKGEPAAPPWETQHEIWSNYKPKSEIADPSAMTKAALENQTAATTTATTEEMTTIEDLGLELLA